MGCVGYFLRCFFRFEEVEKASKWFLKGKTVKWLKASVV